MNTTLNNYLKGAQLGHLRNPDKLKEAILVLSQCVGEISGLIKEMPFRDLSQFKGGQNIQGETAQWLDVAANDIVRQRFVESKIFSRLVSEEEEQSVRCGGDVGGEFLLAYDPLDGSSNLGANIPVGTIFAIWERKNPDMASSDEEYFVKGHSIVAAGYSVYGPNTLLVISLGEGLHEFTFKEADKAFYRTSADLKTPMNGKTYSVNEGNYLTWDKQTKDFVDACKGLKNNTSSACGARYVGSLVADVHRNLKKGGIFLYPADSKNLRGKLRMLYECLPMAFLVMQAGGRASDGEKDILSLTPSTIHERCPLVIGSKELVDRYEATPRG